MFVRDRVIASTKLYLNKYLPNTHYETLMTVPTSQQASSYYAAPVGFLKNTVVPQEMLKPFAWSKTTRNHYKGK